MSATATHVDQWSVSPDDFPFEGTDAAQLRAAVGFAVLAPSGHNSQPWLFAVDADHVDVLADRVRALPVVDPLDRELTMSCGAAAETLVIALAGLGRTTRLDVLPESRRPDVVARVTLTGSDEPTAQDRACLHAISKRCSNRGPYTDDGLLPHVLERFETLARHYGTTLHFATPAQKASLAEAISASDRHQMADVRFRRELAAWTHSNRSDHDDGLRGVGQGMSDLMSTIAPLVIRTFDVGKGQAAKDRDLALGSPLMAVISTPHDSKKDWVNAGRSLARLLLEVTAFDLAASFLNQPIELDQYRRQISDTLCTDDVPQLLLRIGTPTKSFPHTPRRRVEDVLTVET